MEDKDLEASLLAVVKKLFSGPSREDLSVNTVRTKCEKENGLEEGFFAQGEWKSKSKELIKNQVNELVAKEESGEPPSSQAVVPTQEKKPSPKPKGEKAQKNGTKRAAPKATKPAPKKRQTKPAPKPKSESESESESELSEPPEDEDEEDEEDDASDDYEEEKAKPKKKQQKKAKAPQRGRKRKATETDDDEAEKSSIVADGIEVSTTGVKEEADEKEDSPLSEPPKSEKEETKPSVAVKDEGDSSPLSSVIDDEPPPPKKQRKPKAAPAKKAKAAAEDDDGDSSELSSVIDDEPPAKKKRKSKEPAAKKTAAPKGAARKSAGGGEEADPDEAEVKKLQGQLVKCGVRKIWGFELKGCGGDAKAKIRHLRGMLRDVGMDGRFSEAKAREIKERRELAAELEAVNEMNDLWGVGGRRGRRAAAPKGKLAEDSEDDEEGGGGGDKDGQEKGVRGKGGDGEEDEDSDAPKASSRRRKVRPELAFLGDDDSDDD
ncbi:hypothetical protein INS49_013545 [Diaporthe citri]|uniref:uncharacterized protein n=1 Tax=Diaporthe citri TaxID=83186 RepID=UPI001C806CB2|nr:uncharacterized protein INS49_013545 [Diaporthe citri]KAG6357666.1 hypothetical protein INS49_013545 [Diaporthe citri]